MENAAELRLNRRRNTAYYALIAACFLLYIVLTASKNLYTAEKTTLYFSGSFGSLTDLASTMEYYFYTYAVTQVLLVFLIKRLNLKWFLTGTLALSAILTLLVAFTGELWEHYLIFSINGCLQAGVWGGLIKVLGTYLPSRLLPFANQLMTSGPAVAGALAYVVAALFGENWRLPFLVLGLLTLACILLYFVSVTRAAVFPFEASTHVVKRADGTQETVSDEADNDFIHLRSKRRIFWFYVCSVILGIALTALYFAVNNNLDIFLREVGGFSNDISKWLTILAPLLAALGPIVIVRVCEWHKNFITVCVVCFGAAFLLMLALLFLFRESIWLSLLILILYLVAVNGGRSISLSIAAMKLREKIDPGVYSTMVNAAASISAGLAPKLITSILDREDLSVAESWQSAFGMALIWNGIIIALLLLATVAVQLLHRRDARRARMNSVN